MVPPMQAGMKRAMAVC